jgi:hypothetical protein
MLHFCTTRHDMKCVKMKLGLTLIGFGCITQNAYINIVLYTFPEIPRFRDDIKTERSHRPYDFHPGFRYGCGNQPIQPMHASKNATKDRMLSLPIRNLNIKYLK